MRAGAKGRGINESALGGLRGGGSVFCSGDGGGGWGGRRVAV